MAYAQGGLVSASDYNTLVGSNSTTASTLNYIYSIGYATYGYGQTAVSTVSGGINVTATQWTTLLTALNNVIGHQSGSGSQITGTNYTAGGLIQYFANVNTSITTTIQTNHNLYSAQGSTTTGTLYTATANAAAAVAFGPTTLTTGTRTVTFSTSDAARYFFNAGGQINFVVVSTASSDGTTRSSDAATILGNIGTYQLKQTQYFAASTSAANVVAVTSSLSPYTSDYATLQLSTNGANIAGNGDNGSTLTFTINLQSPAHSAFNGALDVSCTHRVDIVPPETTYLSSTTVVGSWLPVIT